MTTTATSPARSTATIERELAAARATLAQNERRRATLPARIEELKRAGNPNALAMQCQLDDYDAAIARQRARADALQAELDNSRHQEALALARADLARRRREFEARVVRIGPALDEFVRKELRGLGEDAEKIAQLESQLTGRDPTGTIAELLAAPREMMRVAARWLPLWLGIPRRSAPEALGIMDGGRIYETLHRAFFDR